MDDKMQRRGFIRTAALAAGGLYLAGTTKARAFTPYDSVDAELFQTINRVKNPQDKTGLEKKHGPVIDVPDRIKSGEAFPVTVTIGEVIHPMSQAHAIQYVELLAGNEPIGRMAFTPRFSQPRATFFLSIDKPVTLVARLYCNLHGLWEGGQDVKPV